MDVFKFLLANEEILAQRLSSTAANYSEWTQDRVFEETKRVLEGLKANFDKEKALLNTVHGTAGVESVVAEAEQHRKDMQADAENLVMLHVDEPGFEQGLETLSAKFEKHKEFCEKTLFPKLKELVSEADLSRVSDQLDAVVLDG